MRKRVRQNVDTPYVEGGVCLSGKIGNDEGVMYGKAWAEESVKIYIYIDYI